MGQVFEAPSSPTLITYLHNSSLHNLPCAHEDGASPRCEPPFLMLHTGSQATNQSRQTCSKLREGMHRGNMQRESSGGKGKTGLTDADRKMMVGYERCTRGPDDLAVYFIYHLFVVGGSLPGKRVWDQRCVTTKPPSQRSCHIVCSWTWRVVDYQVCIPSFNLFICLPLSIIISAYPGCIMCTITP